MYPRTVVLDNAKMLKLETDFGDEIKKGREVSKKIEEIELEMGKIDIKLQMEEAKVDIKDLKAKADEVIKEMEGAGNEFKDKIKGIEKEIFARMAEKTDPKLREQHEALKKQKEELETERNKNALKAQKIKDRIVPTAQRLIKPHLENKYEDLGKIEVVNGQVTAQIFSHLDEWSKAFELRLAKQRN